MKSVFLFALMFGGIAGQAFATSVTVNGKSTFLATSINDSSALPFVDLSGLTPGTLIDITWVSTGFCYDPAACTPTPMVGGVFSSTSLLSGAVNPNAGVGAPNQLSDVVTNEYFTSTFGTPGPNNTYVNDFLIENGLTITVPTGATNLLLGIIDSYYSDNTGSVLVTVTQVTAPEPASIFLALGGIAAIAVARKRVKATRE